MRRKARNDILCSSLWRFTGSGVNSPEGLGDRGDRGDFGALNDVFEPDASGTSKLRPNDFWSSINGASCVDIDDTDELSSSPVPRYVEGVEP